MSASCVYIRAVDADDTFVYWRWSDAAGKFFSAKIGNADLAMVLTDLHHALPLLMSGETGAAAVERALTTGAFADRHGEARLAGDLAAVLLPAALREQILLRHNDTGQVQIRMTPSPLLAQVPWELLPLDANRRLLDVAMLTYDPPATATVGAASAAKPMAGPLFIVDPKLPGSRSGQTLNAAGINAFREHITGYERAGCKLPVGADNAVGAEFTRLELGELLRARQPSRIVYFGHVSSRLDQPGSASLHLSDTAAIWGLMEPLGEGGDAERHRPFSALDLLQGTTECRVREQRLPFGFEQPERGRSIWPMPARVAIIACEGGADYRATETFGLVIAMIDAGAELVTTTRWTMPTDYAFQKHHPKTAHNAMPTSDLARSVDIAHHRPHPLEELVAWQRERLQEWRRDGAITASPLVWASLTTTVRRAREDNVKS